MPMQMWLTRPREFEQLDQAINGSCCDGDLERLESWVQTLDDVVADVSPNGIGTSTGVFPGPGSAHFTEHWVGDFSPGASVPPTYWPYAWGKPAEWNPVGGQPDTRLRLDLLLSFGLRWSIRKVIDARQMVDAGTDEWNRPVCSPCRTHVTVWVCSELSECEMRLAAADLDFRKSAFRVGVIEARDSVVFVIKTPRPIELTGGVCDPTKVTAGGPEELYKEPVIVTEAFTAGETPHWTQPIINAPSVLGAGTIHEVADLKLPAGGHMPAGTYPDTNVENCTFVPMPTTIGEKVDDQISAPTTSELIKELRRGAARDDGFRVPGRLDLSEELIRRLRITIADE